MSNGTKVLGKDEHIGKRIGKRIKEFLLNNALIITMAVAVIYIAIKNPNFIRTASVINILSDGSLSACCLGHRRLHRAYRHRPFRRTRGRPDGLYFGLAAAKCRQRRQ